MHGITGKYPPFYSVESSNGLILGNGNIGKYLSFNDEEIHTYLSRDGGLSWSGVRKGPHVYEIGDYGGLIVMAETSKITDKILYSWDEGETFQEIILNTKFLVKNIIIEPSSTRQHFVIYGETQMKNGEKKGILMGINFKSLNLPQCRKSDEPEKEDSDYEIWTPNDGRIGHECLMGTRTIYVRRKPKRNCFNGITFERKKKIEQCKCTEDDYECDYGFTRLYTSDPCTMVNDLKNNLLSKPPKLCFNYYTISKGYRKVPGNHCVGGVNYDPIIIACPNSIIFSSVSLIIFLFLLIILIVLIVTKFNRYSHSDVSKLVNNCEVLNSNQEEINNQNNNNEIINTDQECLNKVKIDYIDIEKDHWESNDELCYFDKDDDIYNGSLRVIKRIKK